MLVEVLAVGCRHSFLKYFSRGAIEPMGLNFFGGILDLHQEPVPGPARTRFEIKEKSGKSKNSRILRESDREVWPTNVSVKLKTKAPQHIREGFGSELLPFFLKIFSQGAIEPMGLTFSAGIRCIRILMMNRDNPKMLSPVGSIAHWENIFKKNDSNPLPKPSRACRGASF